MTTLAQPTHPQSLADTLWSGGLLRNVLLALAGTLALAISAKIQVPFYPVPMTMQTFVVLVIGMAYGWRLGGATVLLYLAQGAAGLPVFAAGGGLAYFAGPTAGYLVGFFVSAVVVGLLAQRAWDRHVVTTLIAMTIGTAIIFAFGAAWLSVLAGVEVAVTKGVLPFIYGAVFKIGLAAAVLPLAWKFTRKGGA
ncbi:MAG: biotin transporter BioY [Pseudomonadota bacterium]